jgi:hypothetical protein
MPLPIYVRDWNRIMVRAAAAKIKVGAPPGTSQKNAGPALEVARRRHILELF